MSTIDGVSTGVLLPVSLTASTNIALRNVTTAQAIKGTAGSLFGIQVLNTTAAAAYVQIHNVAAPTLGTTTPVLELLVPAGGSATLFLGDRGVALAGTAIAVASTTAEAGAVVSAAGVMVFAQYA